MPAELAPPIPAALAARIRLVVLDVDGVLTDGGIYLGSTDAGERVEMKRFDIQDGLGIRMLQEAGITVSIVTGRESHAVRLRAEELGIAECHQDRTAAKLRIVEEMLGRLGLAWDQVAFLGDDVPDLPILRRAGLPATVANATEDARAASRWWGRRAGGRGAVREFAESLLRARGGWSAAVETYVADREAGR